MDTSRSASDHNRLEQAVAELAEWAALPEGVVDFHDGGDGRWGVTTAVSRDGEYQTSPCARCPWRKDAPLGAFPPEVYRHSASTTYDMSVHVFSCHACTAEQPKTCAGFLLRGAADNLAIRRRNHDYSDVHAGGAELYDSYRDMAIANGVDPDDPALAPCRGDRHGRAGADRTPPPADATGGPR
ncbi:DUF6283 family protein [Planomonospora parontospora]|uniref:DUF6283 family protein n=1 Tax=Planomonospora parontospora TaxID=58119 RepID=UPI00167136FE|nr:DUF6283 family protein [Planomonospora parontospora]GGL55109.1 hypothetical protein GCM10014719_65500 [Planomonospora parontospora subsp. antibiotica]GII19776.1 hypothetical protein Ppa05_65020 [Planomonospora parontospora subsp. antibiotica]